MKAINDVCTYDDWCIFRSVITDKLWLRNNDGEEFEIKEVFRIDFPNYENKTIEEILDYPLCKYDYSGELNDCSAYVFWKEV